MRRFFCVLVGILALAGCPSATPAARMATFDHAGFVLSGAEYWPYIGDREPSYPEEVLWGFYPRKGVVPPGETDPNPDDASPAAVACAEKAFRELKNFLLFAPDDLVAIKRHGEAHAIEMNLFYLWVNDYSRASDPFPSGVRPSRLWYWKRKEPVAGKPAGYWKWEATLTKNGECKTPEPSASAATLKQMRASLDATDKGSR